MRGKRQLAEHVWYWVWTKVNVGEPLFQLAGAEVVLCGVLRDLNGRYDFEMRGLKLEDDCLSFYIKPGDGLELPKIMQWLKQTFAVRLNVLTGRLGHIWGERYVSWILWEGPPEWAEEVYWAEVGKKAETPLEEILTYELFWVSPRENGKAQENRFLFKVTAKPASPPG